MADTRVLKQQAEPFVRESLEAEFGQPFTQQYLAVGQRADGSPAMYEFDAVSADRRIVAGIKSSSGKTSGGRRPSGKIAAAYRELYYLSLADAECRILVLTDPEFHQIMTSECDDLVASEHAFLCQRLALVERWLANPHREFIPATRGRVRRRTRPATRQNLTYRREARLLRKLLERTREGQVLTTVKAWRRELGKFLIQHRQRYRGMQDAYDAWWQLPREERAAVPRPPRPPSARYIDYDGAPWIIDDRFLALLDDLIARLQKWIEA